MIKRRLKHTLIFILFDGLSGGISWSLFFAYRKYIIESDKFGYKIPVELDKNFYLALILIPIYWITLYFLAGHYKDVWRKSRINEISKTFTVTVIGVILLFFALLLDDEVRSYQSYYKSILALFALNFGLTIFFRLIGASIIKGKLRAGKIGFNTIVVGNNQKSLQLVQELLREGSTQGNIFKGFVSLNGDAYDHILKDILPNLGNYKDLPSLITRYEIEEVIIGIESSKHADINNVTNVLEDQQVVLKIIPDLYDMMSGQVRMNNVIGAALIEINHDSMPQWQKIIKRGLDVFSSLLILTLFMPIFMIIALAVKLGSKGPVFYKQIRLGYKGKPFHIFKFRTMITDSEVAGPMLSSANDSRITPVGKWLRKYRLDEIPQFFNVLIGEMSLVGPRPERKFFIDQIVKLAPHYKHLHRVKPGITSWGQVKYGYAENVDQMVERLKFDILYIENRSIAIDLRILIYTILTVVQGKGR
ncbi:MAG: polyprenyl glycosylphosphotransferase [Bacteroidetes bacterium B1(2017)]|nr:MAG: polyprenyl glycosylphosphotransferase [Bacteroidetes bacterium B1(2017)]